MVLYKNVIKKILIIALISTVNLLNTTPLKCISIKNQKCKVTEVIINNEYVTYP